MVNWKNNRNSKRSFYLPYLIFYRSFKFNLPYVINNSTLQVDIFLPFFFFLFFPLCKEKLVCIRFGLLFVFYKVLFLSTFSLQLEYSQDFFFNGYKLSFIHLNFCFLIRGFKKKERKSEEVWTQNINVTCKMVKTIHPIL